jgi:hypothetical protein
MSWPWFKIYNESRNDPKLESLTDAQHRVWYRLICFSSEQTERGTITGYEDLDLLAVEVSRGDTDLLRQTLTRLVKLRIVAWSEDEGNKTTFINFAKRQAPKPSDEPEAIRERVTRHRQNKRNALQPPDEQVKRGVTRYTPNVTRIDVDIEQERESNTQRVDDPIEGEERASAQPTPPESTSSSSSSSDSSPATSFPPMFKMTAEMEAWASRNLPELDIGEATEEWKASMQSNRQKYRYTDWTQTWFAAMRKADKWQKERGGSKNGTTNGHRESKPAGAGTARSRQNEASVREEMEWRAGRHAREHNLEGKTSD